MRQRRSIGMAAATVAAAAAFFSVVAVSSAGAAAKAGTSCPSFQVLHNDRIGQAVLPAGTYAVKPGRRSGLSCQKASALFTRFLEDYDGVLPHHWRAVPKASGRVTFTRGGGRSFRVVRGGKTGEGGGGSHVGSLCPNNFHVLHNDHIGPLEFSAGFYQFYIPRRSKLSCASAAKHFGHFLGLPSGNLPNGWGLKTQRAVFFRRNDPRQKRFRVDPGT